jgi:ATP-dependent 26S proteasome regulatory subunit
MNIQNTSLTLIDYMKAKQPGIHLRSIEEPRAMTAMKQVAKSTNRKFIRWSMTSGVREYNGEIKQILEGCEFEAALKWLTHTDQAKNGPMMLAMMDPWDDLTRPFAIRALREALQDCRKDPGHTIVLVGREFSLPQELQDQIAIVDLDLPDRKAIDDYITGLAKRYEETMADRVNIDMKSIPHLGRACAGLTLDEVKSVVSLGIVRHKAVNSETVALALEEKKQIVQRSGRLTYEESEVSFDDVGGLENAKDWLTKRSKLFSDEARAKGIKSPRGILLTGCWGTGKSLISKAIANAWGQPLLRLDAGRLFGSLVGESESNLRQALKTAEAVAPCILFIDEIEKGFGRGGGGDAGTSQRVLGTMLTWFQECKKDIFIVGSCNELNRLDPAMVRRFDELFFVDLPDADAREEIFKIHLSKVKTKLALGEEIIRQTEGYSGAEIEKIVQAAATEAFYVGKPLTLKHLTNAANSIKPLSLTMKAQIEELRELVKSGRAKPAGGSLEKDAAKRAEQHAEVEV